MTHDLDIRVSDFWLQLGCLLLILLQKTNAILLLYLSILDSVLYFLGHSDHIQPTPFIQKAEFGI